MITQCIDNLLKATLRKMRQTKPSKMLVGAEKMKNPIEAKQVNGSQVIEKYSWCQVIVCVKWQKFNWFRVTLSAEWQSNIVPSYCNMIYLEVSKFWADIFVFLELVNEEEDKNDELVAQNNMLVAITNKFLEEDELWGRYNVSYLIHRNPWWS